MRSRRGRPDPSELAYERLRAGSEPAVALPEQLHRFPRRKIVLYVFLGLLVVMVLRDGLGAPPPKAAGSCTRPAYAFSTDEVKQDGAVKWSVAGPDGTQVVIRAGAVTLLGPLPLKECGASGRFGARLPDGDHTVRVLLIEPDGSQVVVGEQRLTVNAPP